MRLFDDVVDDGYTIATPDANAENWSCFSMGHTDKWYYSFCYKEIIVEVPCKYASYKSAKRAAIRTFKKLFGDIEV